MTNTVTNSINLQIIVDTKKEYLDLVKILSKYFIKIHQMYILIYPLGVIIDFEIFGYITSGITNKHYKETMTVRAFDFIETYENYLNTPI